MKEKIHKVLSKILPYFVVIMVTVYISLMLMVTFYKPTPEVTPTPSPFIYTDSSALTGFMISEKFEAEFEGFEYPVATEEGEDPTEFHGVYDIKIYRYPDRENFRPFRVDTFDEAVEFITKLGEEWK